MRNETDWQTVFRLDGRGDRRRIKVAHIGVALS